MPEVRQAFQKGIAEVVVAPLTSGSARTVNLQDGNNAAVATLPGPPPST